MVVDYNSGKEVILIQERQIKGLNGIIETQDSLIFDQRRSCQSKRPGKQLKQSIAITEEQRKAEKKRGRALLWQRNFSHH